MQFVTDPDDGITYVLRSPRQNEFAVAEDTPYEDDARARAEGRRIVTITSDGYVREKAIDFIYSEPDLTANPSVMEGAKMLEEAENAKPNRWERYMKPETFEAPWDMPMEEYRRQRMAGKNPVCR